MLQPYFKRLDIETTKPTFALLETLQKKHINSFSFNSLAVLLKQPILLNPQDIIEKIVIKNQGGYCFEHNKLMFEVLKFLGFNVRILIARVLNNQDIDSPRTHRITLLEWEGDKYIIDVGFGIYSSPHPIKIDPKHKDNRNYQVQEEKDYYQLNFKTTKGLFSLYRFNLAHYTEADCVMGNFYSAHYPSATFVNNCVISLILDKETRSFRNGIYHKITKQGTQITEIRTIEQLLKMLQEEFHIFLTSEEANIIFIFIKSKIKFIA